MLAIKKLPYYVICPICNHPDSLNVYTELFMKEYPYKIYFPGNDKWVQCEVCGSKFNFIEAKYNHENNNSEVINYKVKNA